MNKFVTVPMVVTAIAAAAMAAGTMLILSVSATHADGYYRKPAYAPAYEPAPQCCDYANFRGLYIGAHVGYVGSATTATLRDGEAVGEVQQSVTSNAASGGLYGLHLGYNYQRDRFVLGLEGDFTGTNADGRRRAPDKSEPGTTLTARSRLQSLASVRVRAGAVIDHFLLYLTTGLALGSAEFGVAEGDRWAGSKTGSAGIAFGAGVEYIFQHNFVVRGEYLRYAFDASRHHANVVDADSSATYNFDSADTLRIGLSYKFDH